MTLVAVISDIHADLGALERALEAAEREEADEVWCLGDIIGRGPDDIACLERVFAVCSRVLIGNHEAYQIAPEEHDPDLTDYGRDQFLPTRARLAADPRWPHWRERLLELPPGEWAAERLLIIHASPAEPLWHVLKTQGDVALIGSQLPPGTVVVHGHTHIPAYASYQRGEPTRLALGRRELALVDPALEVSLDGPAVRFLNPGSVGLPRKRGVKGVEWGLLELDEDGEPVLFSWRREERA